jgi:hypothetical protein
VSGRMGQTDFIPDLSQGSRNPLNSGAGNEARTRDLNLGKVTCQPAQVILNPDNFHSSVLNGKFHSVQETLVKTHVSNGRGSSLHVRKVDLDSRVRPATNPVPVTHRGWPVQSIRIAADRGLPRVRDRSRVENAEYLHLA